MKLDHKCKFVFITGGVSSSLGKGLTAASLGRLLKCEGYRVNMMKLDPYLNIDPGTMNPFEHGEVFVTEDGGETDLDLGHYERFIDDNLFRESNATTGSIYEAILSKERRGDYLGKTVQVIPHVTDEIKNRILKLAKPNKDIVICELGGTVGDIEIIPFLEAIRQLRRDVGRDNVCYVHLTLVPYLPTSGEHKTKPTQHSVTELRSRGIQPDIIVCRSDKALPKDLKSKISLLCDVPADSVISATDATSIYEIPLNLHKEGFENKVLETLHLLEDDESDFRERMEKRLAPIKDLVRQIHNSDMKVIIGIVGKYVNLPDAYLSVVEAIRHGGFANGCDVELEWVNAELVPEIIDMNLSSSDPEIEELVKKGGLDYLDGIVIPGGFGERGVEGKLLAAKYARENLIPTLGICLGLQVMVCDVARSLAKLEGAHSTEFNPNTPHPVIDLLEEQRGVEDMGGTMRLGAYTAKLLQGTKIQQIYGDTVATERHRHRYEVNPIYREQLEDAGLVVSGESPDGRLVEFVELSDHPFWVGTQAHPEFKSRPDRAHPLFFELIKQAKKRREGRLPHILPIEPVQSDDK